MTEHLGHVTDICSALEHQRGHAVTQEMATPPLVDAGTPQAGSYLATEPVPTDGSAERRDKEVMGISLTHEFRSDGSEVELQPKESSFADGDITILGSLAATNEDRPSVEVHVFDPEVDEFVPPHSA